MANEFDIDRFFEAFGGTRVNEKEKEGELTRQDSAQRIETRNELVDRDKNLEARELQEEGALDLIKTELPEIAGPPAPGPLGSSPFDPIPDSPVDFFTRIGLQFGNTRGKIKRLKKDFDDVRYDEDKGRIVVLDKGDWHMADPNQLLGDGNAWDLREALVDSVEFVAEEFLPTAGALGLAATGSVIAPGPGTVAGVVAGDVAGRSANMLIGRLIGTFDATAGEVARDLTWDTIFALGGVGLGKLVRGSKELIKAGAKKLFKKVSNLPTVEAMTTALKNIKEFASANVKEPIKAMLAAGTGVTKEAADNAIERPEFLERNLNRALRRGVKKELTTVIDEAREATILEGQKYLGGAKKALNSVFGKRKDELLADPNISSFRADVPKIADDFMGSLSNIGLLRPVKNKAGKTLAYRLTSDQELDKLLQGADDIPFLRRSAQRSLKKLVEEINPLLRRGPLTGRKGAEAAIKIRSSFNEAVFEATKSNPVLEDAIRIQSRRAKDVFRAAFTGPNVPNSVGEKFSRMNDFYSQNVAFAIDGVKMAGLKREGSAIRTSAAFVSSFAEGRGATADANKILFKRLRGIYNADGQTEAANRFIDLHTAEQFLKRFPHFATSKVGAGIGPGGLAVNVARTALTPIASPRLNARIVGSVANGNIFVPTLSDALQSDPILGRIPFIKQMRDSITQLSVEEKDTLLASPDVFNNMLNTVINAPIEEEQTLRQLLEGSGVIPGQ